MKKIKSIKICFENEKSKDLSVGDMKNCDVFFISIMNIQNVIGSVGIDEVADFYTSNDINIVLNKRIGKKMSGLWDRIIDKSDITGIEIRYESGETKEIFTVWSEVSEVRNYFQMNEIDDEGRLHIKIYNE